MNTTTQQFRIANNEAVMRALGIADLVRKATRVDLELLPNELPLLTVQMYVEETPADCHLPPYASFDLDKACSEAMERVQDHIRVLDGVARIETKNAFQDARLRLYRRWRLI